MAKVVFLYDTTGYAAEPFTRRGVETYIIDILNINERSVNTKATHVLDWNILEHIQDIINLSPDLLIGFPPCTDLAVSGSKHFANKRERNPNFQLEALELALAVKIIGEAVGCPWAFENPNSVDSTLFRKPDITFHPHEYGGYLPEDDVHPDFPKYIAPRDAYNKMTNLWSGNGFRLAKKKPVLMQKTTGKGFNRQTRLLGGKSLKTKMIRSSSPRGVFEGLAQKFLGEI